MGTFLIVAVVVRWLYLEWLTAKQHEAIEQALRRH